jgi:SAM-dependent methyltransferase
MTQAAFESIYDKDEWGAGSGPGSHPYFTIEYRALIQRFISLNDIGSIVDIGCGDWQFSRFIDFGRADYLGFDVVRSVVERNQTMYASNNIKFDMMPDNVDMVPSGDLLILKDVLQHLPNHDVFDILNSVIKRFQFVLITNSYEKIDTAQNIDLPNHGAFRCLDLTAKPYCLAGAYVFEYWAQPWERIRTLLVQH